MNPWMILFCLVAVSACTKNKSEEPSPPAARTKGEAYQELTLAQEKAQAEPNFENHLALGQAYANLKLTQDAIMAFKKSIELNPQSEVATKQLCLLHLEMKEWKPAREYCKSDEQLKTIDSSLQKLKTEAEEIQKTLPSLKGASLTDARLNLGFKFFEMQEYEQAIQAWSKVPKGDPKYSYALNDIVSANILLKKYDLAGKQLEEAEKLDPKNPLIANNKQRLKEMSQK